MVDVRPLTDFPIDTAVDVWVLDNDTLVSQATGFKTVAYIVAFMPAHHMVLLGWKTGAPSCAWAAHHAPTHDLKYDYFRTKGYKYGFWMMDSLLVTPHALVTGDAEVGNRIVIYVEPDPKTKDNMFYHRISRQHTDTGMGATVLAREGNILLGWREGEMRPTHTFRTGEEEDYHKYHKAGFTRALWVADDYRIQTIVAPETLRPELVAQKVSVAPVAPEPTIDFDAYNGIRHAPVKSSPPFSWARYHGFEK